MEKLKSLESLKKDAKKLKKHLGIKQMEALNIIARREGYANYKALHNAFKALGRIKKGIGNY